VSKHQRNHKQAIARQLNWAIYSSMGAQEAMRTLSGNLLTFVHDPDRQVLQYRIRVAIDALAKVEDLARRQTSSIK